MKNVSVITPIANTDSSDTKLRVAAYCRVSTDNEDQLESLEAQKTHYKAYIEANSSWEYAGLYYDEGITGTKMGKRLDLLRLISDCENRKVDLIVTKSISRLSRNTADCLELVRKLTGLGVFIYFEKENLHTGTMENELMLSILTGLAENEATSIAQNSKWSVTQRFQNGTYKLSSVPYGYDVTDGKLIVNEAEAEIVRYIFSEALSGKSSYTIAKALNKRNLITKRGVQWTPETVRGMLKNEKYVGDSILQKTYTDSRFNRHRNNGELEQFLIPDNHERIISREEFDAVNQLITQRAKEKGITSQSDKYCNRYPFSGRIICSECGGVFKRRHHRKSTKCIAWCCTTHIVDAKKCSMKFIENDVLEHAFVTMMNKLIFSHSAVLKPLLQAIRSISAGDGLLSIQEIDKLLDENNEQQNVLVTLMSKGYLDKIVYKKSNNQLLQEAERLQRQKEAIIRLLENGNQHLSEVSFLLQFASKSPMLQHFDDSLFTQLVDRIEVFSRSEIGFVLKCGLTLKETLKSNRT